MVIIGPLGLDLVSLAWFTSTNLFLLGFARFNLVLLRATWFCPVVIGFTWLRLLFNLVLLVNICCLADYLASMGFPWAYWPLHGVTWFNLV